MKLKSLPIFLSILLFAGSVCAQNNLSSTDTSWSYLKANGLLPVTPQIDQDQIPIHNNLFKEIEDITIRSNGLLIPLDDSFEIAPLVNGGNAPGSPPEYRNDDGYTDAIPLQFEFNFYGDVNTSFYINNNGNVSFGGGYWTYTPTGFPINQYPMVAPFWADVDTRNEVSGLVYYKSEPHRLTIIWDGVGFYSGRADKLNTFELIITDGTDPLIGVGNNVAFSYGDMQWTTGDASNGTNGFGGVPATVGINKGDGSNFALIGRFDHSGSDYDGPIENADGVDFLDNKTFSFNTSTDEANFYTLNGSVFDNATSNPIENASVTLTGPGGATFSESTNSSGIYSVNNLTVGNYNITVTAEGYQSDNRNVYVSQDLTENFNLIPTENQNNNININNNLVFYADNIVELQNNYYKLSGNVNINGVLEFNNEVRLDKRASNYYPLIISSARIRTYDRNNLVTLFDGGVPYKFYVDGNNILPKELAFFFEIPMVVGGFPLKLSGITVDETNNTVAVKVLPKLPFPLDKLVKYNLEDYGVGDWYDFVDNITNDFSGAIIYSPDSNKEYAFDISIDGPVNFGVFALKDFSLYFNTSENIFGGGVSLKIPGVPGASGSPNLDGLMEKPVQVNSTEGDSLYTTNLEKYLEMSRALGLSFLELGFEIEFVNGAINKFIVSTSARIPIAATGLFITEITGGVDDLATDEWKIIANVDIETGLEIPNLGSPVKLDDFGVKIAPVTYFEGGGVFQIFNKDVSSGFLIYDADEGLIQLTCDLNLADILVGNVSTKLQYGDFYGSLSGTLKTPTDLPWYLNWAENKVLASVIAEIHNKMMQAQGQLGPLSIANKIEFGKTSFPYFHYYIGTNFEDMIQIWRGSRDNRQVRDFLVPENAGQILIVAGNDQNLFHYHLMSPSGKFFDLTNTYYKQYESSLQTVMVLENPEPGNWSFVTSQQGDIIVETKVVNQPPSVILNNPNIRGSRSNLINLKFNDYSDTLSVGVYYDDDSMNYDGILIKQFEVINNAELNFEWNNSDIPDGEYFIYCSISDGKNAPIMQYSPGSIVVSNANQLAAPQNFTIEQVGDSILAQWSGPDDPSIVGTTIFYRKVNSDFVNSKTVSNNSAFISILDLGIKYSFWAAYVDFGGGLSRKTEKLELIVNNTEGNNSPYFTEENDKYQSFIVGSESTFEVSYDDTDGDVVALNLLNSPQGLALINDLVSWTPTEDDKGSFNLIVEATDGIDADTLEIELRVFSKEQSGIKLKFSSLNLYEGDNKFVTVQNMNANDDNLPVQIKNLRTDQQISIVCSIQSNNLFMSDFDLIPSRESLEIQNGDTLRASYNYNDSTYTTIAIYNNQSQPSDNTPPAQISDLTSEFIGNNQILIKWTATGDDGTQGEALAYDLRFSFSNIDTEDKFLSANLISNLNYPSQSGQTDSLIVNLSSIDSSDKFDEVYFALVVQDEMQNRSEISNIAKTNYVFSPTDLVVTLLESFKVTLDWSVYARSHNVRDVNYNYKLLRKRNNGLYQVVAENIDSTNYLDNLFAQPDGNYTYALISATENVEGDTLYSAEILLERFIDTRILCSIVDSSDYSGITFRMEATDSIYAQSFDRITNSTGLITLANVYYSEYIITISKDTLNTIIDTVNINASNNEFNYTLGLKKLTISFSPGWNMFSVPLQEYDMGSEILFNNGGAVFGFEGDYQAVQELEVGKGYWKKFISDYSKENEGIPLGDSIRVNEGWNLIGALDAGWPVESIYSTPENIIVSNFFEYDNGYTYASILEPSFAYWVKTSSSGYIFFDETRTRKEKNTDKTELTDLLSIVISNSNRQAQTLYISENVDKIYNNELPPQPPAGIFDVRYSDNTFVRDISDNSNLIQITSAAFPIKINVNGFDARIKDVIDGSFVNKLVKDGEQLVINNKNINKLQIEPVELPIEYTLYQNYPNPFNPSTIIKYGLPEDAKVKIDIYNALGQRVRTIVDTQIEAGYHEVQLNANQLASGVYFYRIHAGSFIDTKKMLLIK